MLYLLEKNFCYIKNKDNSIKKTLGCKNGVLEYKVNLGIQTNNVRMEDES